MSSRQCVLLEVHLEYKAFLLQICSSGEIKEENLNQAHTPLFFLQWEMYTSWAKQQPGIRIPMQEG